MKQVDPLIRLIKYHEEVSEYLENLKKIMGFLHEKEAWEKITPIEDFFKQNVIGHFRFEEKTIFPPCLLKVATPELVNLILELQREHGFILAKVEEFRSIISEKDIPLDKEISTKLNIVGREIIDILLIHTSKEDDELLPILEKNRQIFDL